MNTVKTFTGQLKAFMPNYRSHEELNDASCVDWLLITSSGDYYREQGYPMVGIATVTVEIFDDKTILEGKVASLKAQLQKERADSEVRCNYILEKISKLQALEYTVDQ